MTILFATDKPIVKKSMKKLLQLENLYNQEKFSAVHLLTKDCETLSKLQISFHIVLLQKLHGVQFTSTYENENACKNVIFEISEYLFEENIKKIAFSKNYIYLVFQPLIRISI